MQNSTHAEADRFAPRDARAAALRVLSDLREGRKTATASIEALVERIGLTPEQRALTTEIVMGILRHRLTLARVLGLMTSRGWKKVSRELQHVLMIGAYQLLWLDGIPEFAAVDEAVKQGKQLGGPPAGRFVNAVLRGLLRAVAHRRQPLAEADPRRSIPIDRDSCCEFNREILPDPDEDIVHYLSEAMSVPTFLVKRWVVEFGRRQAETICRAAILRPSVFLRPNRRRTDAATLVESLGVEGVECSPIEGSGLVWVKSLGGLGHTKSFQQGLFQQQDPTAWGVVERMELKTGQFVLDLCAGLGTKTTQIAESVGDSGIVLACDIDRNKLQLLGKNCHRLGHENVRNSEISELEELLESVPRLDWILIDAPCSNSGVISRRPEARYRIGANALRKLSRLQLDLLETAASFAGQGTKLMYSTCSIEPDENVNVCHEFAKNNPDWRLSDSCLTLPSSGDTPDLWQDGGFWATWSRAAK